ncbi:MAG: TadE/TadG family type IV pilus assembly protein [Rhodopila sp.]|jgi:Flp pilus assembly protein TadG
MAKRRIRFKSAVRLGAGGVAAAEFALIAPVLIAMMLSVYDIGNAVWQRLLLQQALRAGGQYAMSFPTQTSGITQVITASLSGLTQVTVVAPAMSPPPGDGPPYYVTLSASRPYAPFLLPLNTENVASYVVRVQ